MMAIGVNQGGNQGHRAGHAGFLSIIAKNSLANLAKMAALSLTVLVLPPLLVRVLDKSTYATWMLILQIGAYVSLFDGSVQSAISRFIAHSRGLQDDGYMGRMLSSAGLVMVGAAGVTAMVTVLGSWQLHHLFPSIPPSLIADARDALLIFGISLSLGLPFSTLTGAFLGLQMNQVNAVAGSLGRIIGASGAAWAAYEHRSLTVMALWIAFGNLLQALMFFIAWKRLPLHGMIEWKHITRAAVREFTTFCYAIFATQLGGVLITGLDLPIVAAFDFRSAAYYAVAVTVSTLLVFPQTAVVNTLVPVAAEISATAAPERLGALVIKTSRYSTAILCLLALPLALGMSIFLVVWVGPDYARHALPMAMILVLAQFLRLTLLPYAAVGFAAGQQHRMLISPLGEGIVNLVCSLLGAEYLGAIGVAIGTLIGAVAGVLLHFFNSMPRTDRVSFHRTKLATSGILQPVACCLPALILTFAACHFISNRMTQSALICVGELAAALVLWKTNFDDRERREILDLATRMIRRLSRKSAAATAI